MDIDLAHGQGRAFLHEFLPPLVRQAGFNGTAEALKHWIGLRPHNALTVLDAHDGFGIIDIGADALRKPVGAALLQLNRVRNEQPKFQGALSRLDSAPHELHLSWQDTAHWAESRFDLSDMKRSFQLCDDAGGELGALELALAA